MSVLTIEGVVDNVHIRLKDDVRLPDNTRVFVAVPNVEVEQVARIYSPRLAHPEQAADFRLEIVEELPA
jgi:hypothetical protein